VQQSLPLIFAHAEGAAHPLRSRKRVENLARMTYRQVKNAQATLPCRQKATCLRLNRLFSIVKVLSFQRNQNQVSNICLNTRYKKVTLILL
jgi:hypothetical protein